jgi:hypothetical protein
LDLCLLLEEGGGAAGKASAVLCCQQVLPVAAGAAATAQQQEVQEIFLEVQVSPPHLRLRGVQEVVVAATVEQVVPHHLDREATVPMESLKLLVQ